MVGIKGKSGRRKAKYIQIRTSVTLKPKILFCLKQEAQRTGRSMSWIANRALDRYLMNEVEYVRHEAKEANSKAYYWIRRLDLLEATNGEKQ